MTLTNLLLIVGSAVIHVVAHVALKRTQDRVAFVWWMILWGGVLFAPVLLFINWQAIPPLAWGIIAVSAVFEALYFFAIARAYRTGDLSIVYPLARGTAPVLLLIWSGAFLRESITAGGVAGVLLIATGLYFINLPQLGAWLEPLRSLRQSGSRWALLAGLCISLYTVIDRIGIQLVEPIIYTYISLWITLVWLTPPTLRTVGWHGLWNELRASRLSTVIAGFTTLAAYAIVLYAIQNGTPASYAGATREVSVVFGVVVGMSVLKEKGTVMRFVGATCVAGGVATIALFG